MTLRYVDGLDKFVKETLSFDFLFYFRPLLTSLFEDCCRDNFDQLRYFSVIAKVASGFLDTVRPISKIEVDAKIIGI